MPHNENRNNSFNKKANIKQEQILNSHNNFIPTSYRIITHCSRNMRQPSTILLSIASLFLLLEQEAFAADFGEEARPYWIAHGTLMFLAWGVIFPLGALVALYRQHMGYDNGTVFTWAPNFYLPHFYFQMSGLVLNIVAFALAARGSFLEYETGNPFADVLWNFETDLYPWNHHVKWGVSVLTILVIQCILGYVHHLLKHAHDEKVKHGSRERWTRPIVPSWAHVIIGPLAMVVAYCTLIQGFQIFTVIFFHTESAPNASIKFGYAMIGISGISFLLAYLYGRFIQYASGLPSRPIIQDERNVEIQPLARVD